MRQSQTILAAALLLGFVVAGPVLAENISGTIATTKFLYTIRRNFFAGDGSAANNNNDFGVGLIGNSSGNSIEDNSIGGNANGLLLQVNTTGNFIRLNVIAGNPPSQFSKDYGA